MRYRTASPSRHPAPVVTIDCRAGRLKLRVARSFAQRAIGLLATRSLPPAEGLLIVPCRSIHTFGMRYAIDALFVDRQGSVLAMHPRLSPWRIASCAAAVAVLELAAGAAQRAELRVGSRLVELGPWLLPPTPGMPAK
jgi:uncharacterized protein